MASKPLWKPLARSRSWGQVWRRRREIRVLGWLFVLAVLLRLLLWLNPFASSRVPLPLLSNAGRSEVAYYARVSPAVPADSLALVRRMAAQAAAKGRVAGASDLSGVFVGCDVCRDAECATTAFGAVRLLQTHMSHRVHMLIPQRFAPQRGQLHTCAEKYDAASGITFGMSGNLERLSVLRIKLGYGGSVAEWHYTERGFPTNPYTIFIHTGSSVPMLRAHGWLSFFQAPMKANAKRLSGAGMADALNSYEHVLVGSESAMEEYQQVSDLSPCGPSVFVQRGRQPDTSYDEYATPMSELFQLYDLNFAKVYHKEKWQFFQRLARDLRMRRLALCRLDVTVDPRPENVVLIVDSRKDVALPTTAKQLLTSLGEGWGIMFVYGEGNEGYSRAALRRFKGATFASMATIADAAQSESLAMTRSLNLGDLDPRSGEAYNIMWKTSSFWRSLGPRAQRVLVYQSDVFLTGVELPREVLSFNYIGAPWCIDGSNGGFVEGDKRDKAFWKMLHESRQLSKHTRVGNGGFSIRSVPEMIHITERFANMTPPNENEDIFYILSMESERRYDDVVAPVPLAEHFSLEIMCPDLEATKSWQKGRLPTDVAIVPFGFHKPVTVITVFSASVETTDPYRFALDIFDRVLIAADAADRVRAPHILPPPSRSAAGYKRAQTGR